MIVTDEVKASQTATTGGRKFDGGKLEYGLLPARALRDTVEVLTIGAQKYERENWRHVPDAKRRYFDALQRHLWDWKMGETLDPETGCSHLAHAMCCLMFLHEHDAADANWLAQVDIAAANAFSHIMAEQEAERANLTTSIE